MPENCTESRPTLELPRNSMLMIELMSSFQMQHRDESGHNEPVKDPECEDGN